MKFLVATDGSESARYAVDYLASFPLPVESEMTVMTVIDPVMRHSEIDELADEQLESYEEMRAATKQAANELLEQEADRLSHFGWKTRILLRSGKPEEEIVKAADELDIDSIVVGSHGLGGIKRFLLGSVCDRLLHHAPCSVLIVKKAESAVASVATNELGHRILVAFDDSTTARNAAAVVASLPLSASSQVTLFSVLPLITMFRQDIRQKLSWFWQSKKTAAEAGLDWARQRLDWSTPNVSAVLKEASNVSDAILEEAEHDRDLVVLGDKGKSATEKFLLGSVTNHVARRATCCVWVVRNKRAS